MNTETLYPQHYLRIVAKSGARVKTVEFPIDEATEKWLCSLEKTDDEMSDFMVRGASSLKVSLSIVNKGFEF